MDEQAVNEMPWLREYLPRFQPSQRATILEIAMRARDEAIEAAAHAVAHDEEAKEVA